MEIDIYTWIGRLVVWGFFGFMVFKFICYVFENLINWLAKRINQMWKFLEYLFYRNEFKEWVKDKDRHPQVENK